MALTAISISWYMIGRFTHGGDAIVTGCAVTHDTGMIVLGAAKCRRVMAYGAIQGCGNMSRRFTSGRCAIVAGSAVIYDTGVIEHRC